MARPCYWPYTRMGGLFSGRRDQLIKHNQHPLSRSAQRLPRGRHRVPPGSTLRAHTRGMSMRDGSQHLSNQRRAVSGTVREERAMQPVMRSLRRITGVHVSTAQEERSGRRCERNGPEGVEPSTVDRQQSPENRAPARSPRLLRASARSRGATSGQGSQSTEWVGRRPRLRLAGGELSRAGRRAVAAGPAG